MYLVIKNCMTLGLQSFDQYFDGIHKEDLQDTVSSQRAQPAAAGIHGDATILGPMSVHKCIIFN